jgi:hypothetical protein
MRKKRKRTQKKKAQTAGVLKVLFLVDCIDIG